MSYKNTSDSSKVSQMPFIKWTFKLKGASEVSQRPPVVFGDRALLTFSYGSGTWRGTLVCVDLKSGQEIWRFEGDHSLNEPLIDEGKFIYLSSFSGTLFKLDFDGKLNWKAQPTNCNCWAPVQCGEVIAFPEIAGQANNTWGISKADGSTEWKYVHGGHGYALATNSTFIVGCSIESGFDQTSTKIYCLNCESGAVIWEATFPKYVFRPIIFDDHVLVGSRGSILCFSLLTGNLVAEYHIAESAALVHAPLKTASGFVCCVEDGTIVSLNFIQNESHASTGIECSLRENWTTHVDGAIEAKPVSSNGELRLICESGKLLTIHEDDGRVIEEMTIPRFTRGYGLAKFDGGVIVAASKEAICFGKNS